MKLNLETKLINENKKLINNSENLSVQEYVKNPHLAEAENLSRLGLNDNISKGKHILAKIDRFKKETEKYNQDRVFHISQIKSISCKYYLRFLPVGQFKGNIDSALSAAIQNYETTYNVRCDRHNTFIMAPSSSFKLVDKPKDPLLFHKINDEYYYLIYKWGNDLSSMRRLIHVFSNPVFTYLVVVSVLGSLAYSIDSIFGYVIIIIYTIICTIINFVNYFIEGTWVRFIKPARKIWNSNIK